MFIDLGESFGVVAAEEDLFPQILGRVRPFRCFDTEIDTTVFFTECGVFRICERTGCAIAQTSDRVRVATETFVLVGVANGRFVRTKLVIYNRPYHFVSLHDGRVLHVD